MHQLLFLNHIFKYEESKLKNVDIKRTYQNFHQYVD